MTSATPRFVAKIESEEPSLRLAVLIDADNAQAAVIEGLLAEVARFGEATVKRIYGDFTNPTSSQWKKVLNQYAIKPMQQFAYTKGKNATDSTMIIDAMDLLYTRRFDGFCLVSSDSDFTGLAMRVREEGLRVIGFGEQKTPDAFRNSCHEFVFTEVLRPTRSTVEEKGSESGLASREQVTSNSSQVPNSVSTVQRKELPRDFMLQAIEQVSDDSGWAHLGTFGSYLKKLQPDFDPRVFDYKKLSELVRDNSEIFQYEEREQAGSDAKVMYVRAK